MVMKHERLNFIILSDGSMKYLFERLGKNVPFEAYNPNHAICSGTSVEEILEKSPVASYEIEHNPIEVMFNE